MRSEDDESLRKLRLSEIKRDLSSYVDPQGFVFHWDDRVFRYIAPGAVRRFEQHLDSGLLRRLEDQFGLVETRKASLQVAELGEGLILEHRKLPLTYCTEWPLAMLRDAGLATLDLAIELLEDGLCLQDAYPWNVLFDGTKPVFVDVGSIVEVDETSLWPAQEQFEAYFLRPSILSSQGKGRAVRAMMLDNISGVRLREFYELASLRYRVTSPMLWLMLSLDRYLQRSVAAKDAARKISNRAKSMIDQPTRRRFLKRLRGQLARIQSPVHADPWTQYYNEIDPAFDRHLKLQTVQGLIKDSRPSSVVDLGCNVGVFALEAARSGARTIAIDSSESCVEGLYATARKEDLNLIPLVADALCPTPSYGFLSLQYPDLYSRVRSDVSLCLGLMHHLVVSGRQSLERIAELIGAVSKRKAIFEYVGPDDANMPHLSGRRDIAYTAVDVLDALSRHFSRIDRLQSDRDTRELFFCHR